jgi:hypothetical protein
MEPGHNRFASQQTETPRDSKILNNIPGGTSQIWRFPGGKEAKGSNSKVGGIYPFRSGRRAEERRRGGFVLGVGVGLGTAHVVRLELLVVR